MQRMTALDPMRYLSETIGPRGSTTEEEAKAAEYVATQLTNLGLAPQRDAFLSAASAYAPYALFTGMLLLSLFLFWQPQPVGAAAAAILTLTALVSVLLELLFRTNPLRWLLPLGDSQNVYVRIPREDAQRAGGLPADPVAKDADNTKVAGPANTIYITAHLDTHRTPLVFSSPGWIKTFGLIMPAALVSAGVSLLLFIVGVFSTSLIWREVALVPGVVMLFILILMIQADRTDYSPGADDNASGVAATLGLAERLAHTPLKNTDVVVVFTGCEEVGCYGADAFFQRHAEETRGATLLVIDQVGAANAKPSVVEGERFLAFVRSDPHLLALAHKVLDEHPEWQAGFTLSNAPYGELSVGAKDGLHCIALGHSENSPSYWHTMLDTMQHADPELVEREQELTWQLLKAIDAVHAPNGSSVTLTHGPAERGTAVNGDPGTA